MSGAGAVLGWVIPAVVVFGGAAILVVVATVLVRRRRRSPRAVAAADRARTDAGAALVHLDDAVSELAIEAELATAMHGGDAAAALGRALTRARLERDRAFAEFRGLEELSPSEARHRVRAVSQRIATARTQIAAALTAGAARASAHAAAPDAVAATRDRLTRVREGLTTDADRIAVLAERFEESETTAASTAIARAIDAASTAEAILDDADRAASDPTRDATPLLVAAERAVQTAGRDARQAQDDVRQLEAAAAALPSIRDAVRDGLRRALEIHAGLEPDAASRLGDEVRRIEAAAAALGDGDRTPLSAVAAFSRLRDRLDLAMGEARTAAERLEGARAALPAALAAADRAIAAATALPSAPADARTRLDRARLEREAAAHGDDPVAALDAARRATRDAEDASALTAYHSRPPR